MHFPTHRSQGPIFLIVGLTLLFASGCPRHNPDQITILNASHDPTRELWRDLNSAFISEYEAESGKSLVIKQSHASSGSQARSIMEGVEADVATLSIWPDTNNIHKAGLIKADWENAFPNRSLPYTSTLVFVVRKGNPKQIKDWPDLIRGDVSIITPSPKTSGNGKLSLLAAWGSVIAAGGSVEDARNFVTEIYKRVPVLDTGSRGSTVTFGQKEIGDVHLALENEAWIELEEFKGHLEIVYPSQSIIHEPHIAIVDQVVDDRGTREVAERYLNFMYTTKGQEIIAKHHFRPSDPEVLKSHADKFQSMKLFTITDFAKDWDEANTRFFAENGEFDQIYQRIPR